jgi:threonine/homoserine/homoserine lactone efflux protein
VKYLLAIFPSAGVLFIFWLAIKSVFEADRRERAAEAKYRRSERDRSDGGEPESPDRD